MWARPKNFSLSFCRLQNTAQKEQNGPALPRGSQWPQPVGPQPRALPGTPYRVGDSNREKELPELDFGPDCRPTVATHTFCN